MDIKEQPIILEGVTYTSELEAARAYNTSMYAVKARIGRGWTLEQAYDIKPRPKQEKEYAENNGKTFLNEKSYEEEFKYAKCVGDPGLRYCPEKYKDYDVCFESVKSNGYNLIYVPEKHRDAKLCMEAIKTMLKEATMDGYYNYTNIFEMLFLVPEDIRTADFFSEIIDMDISGYFGDFIRYVPIKNITRELCLKAIQCGAFPSDIPIEFLDYELCKKGFESGNDMEDIEWHAPEDVVEKLRKDGFIK